MSLTESIKSLAKAGAILFSRILGYLALGLLLNLFILIYYWGSVSALWSSAATLGTSPLLLRLAGALTLLAALASPVVYFILGKKQGISAAVFYIVNRQKEPVMHFTLTKFFEKYPELLVDLVASRPAILGKLGDVKTFAERQPYLVRLVLRSFLSRFDFVTEMDKAITTVEHSGLSGPAKIEMLSTEISRNLTLDTLQPGFGLPTLIVATNIGLVWLLNRLAF